MGHLSEKEDTEIRNIMFYGTIAAILVGGYSIYSEISHQRHIAAHPSPPANKAFLGRHETSRVHWDPDGQTPLFDIKGRSKNAAAKREEGISGTILFRLILLVEIIFYLQNIHEEFQHKN